MKFFESKFEEYTTAMDEANLHPELVPIFARLPPAIANLTHLVLYGPPGVGKYTQALHVVRRYSPTRLKYEKKLTLVCGKDTFLFKTSDVHVEVDMSMLGCATKALWHALFQQFVHILSARATKTGIILCHNFQATHARELLAVFYSYVQENNISPVTIKFMLITDTLSSLPRPLSQSMEAIHVRRPRSADWERCFGVSMAAHPGAAGIKHVRALQASAPPLAPPAAASPSPPSPPSPLFAPHQALCGKLLAEMQPPPGRPVRLFRCRELWYEMMMAGMNIPECVWCVLHGLLSSGRIPANRGQKALRCVADFFRAHSNHFRLIFHLEQLSMALVLLAEVPPAGGGRDDSAQAPTATAPARSSAAAATKTSKKRAQPGSMSTEPATARDRNPTKRKLTKQT